jgi:hypothetical protein
MYAAAAVIWSAFYVGIYIAVVHAHQSGVTLVYGLMVVIAGLLVLPTAAVGPTLRRTNLLLVALVIYVLTTLWGTVGGGPIGLFLIPAIVTTARALSKIRRDTPPELAGRPPTQPTR